MSTCWLQGFPKNRIFWIVQYAHCKCPHEPLLKLEPSRYLFSQVASRHVNISITVRLMSSAYSAFNVIFVNFDFFIIFWSINVSLSASSFSSRWQYNTYTFDVAKDWQGSCPMIECTFCVQFGVGLQKCWTAPTHFLSRTPRHILCWLFVSRVYCRKYKKHCYFQVFQILVTTHAVLNLSMDIFLQQQPLFHVSLPKKNAFYRLLSHCNVLYQPNSGLDGTYNHGRYKIK